MRSWRKISVELKQKIYNDLFNKGSGAKVTLKKFVIILNSTILK